MASELRIERVVVTGGRHFRDGARIEADLRALLPLGLRRVAEGWCPLGGADDLARAAWRRLTDKSTEGYPMRTDLDGPGKAAGPRRNIRMLEAERPDLVLAYPDPESRGTWHCMREALQRGITVAVWMRGIRELPLRGLTVAFRHYGDRAVIGPPASFTASGVAARVMEVFGG